MSVAQHFFAKFEGALHLLSLTRTVVADAADAPKKRLEVRHDASTKNRRLWKNTPSPGSRKFSLSDVWEPERI